MLYYGNIKDGDLHDTTDDACYIVKEENTDYMYYKGHFENGKAKDNEELVYKLYARKQGTYFVNKVFPEWGMDVLRPDLIERARKMTRARSNNHPWLSMDDEELLRSAGLILLDHESRREGITLAAILLFGKDTTIMSVVPQHKTDMIFRVQNLDRYDDRDVIVTNLLDSYDRMSEFAKNI